MSSIVLTLIFTVTLWLGCYLIVRSSPNRGVLWIGIGLVVYAAIIGLDLLSTKAALSTTRSLLDNLGAYLLLIPGIFWILALVTLANADSDPAENSLMDRIQFWRRSSPQGMGLFLAGSILLGMSLSLILFRLPWIPPFWLALAVGLDLCILGYAIARLNAFDLGEALLPDFLRSLDGALLLVLLFAGPAAVTMFLIEGNQLVLWGLLLTLTSFAILLQTLREPFEATLDRMAFGATSLIQKERADLRAAADAVPRIAQPIQPEAAASDQPSTDHSPVHQPPSDQPPTDQPPTDQPPTDQPPTDQPSTLLDDPDFDRLTRRALSSFGDLNRLAASPLTQLPLIEQGLAEQGLDANTLTRAAELKRLLTDAIHHLKPAGENGFSPTDEWRYYNSLYFPYVLGLRPYSRRAEYTELDESTQAALDWFRGQVPERTLHNWQNGAAKLVAQYLRELATE